MIVADTHLIAYFHLPGPYSASADQVQKADPHWVAPGLWRSEFRNVLVTCMRAGRLGLDDALLAMARAECLVESPGCDVPSRTILALARASHCTAYDCEFVALAQALAVPLVTSDQRLLQSFPEVALDMERFVRRATGASI